jgi:hypothetical protein
MHHHAHGPVHRGGNRLNGRIVGDVGGAGHQARHPVPQAARESALRAGHHAKACGGEAIHHGLPKAPVAPTTTASSACLSI